jgi:hypothetical protein
VGVSPALVGGYASSARWLAPELICLEGSESNARARSKESDVYALAMLMYEVRTRRCMFGPASFGCVTYFHSGILRVTPV